MPSASLLQVLRLRTELPCCSSAGWPVLRSCKNSAEETRRAGDLGPLKQHTSGRAAAQTTFVLHASRWVAGLAATGVTDRRDAVAATMTNIEVKSFR